MFGGGFGSAFEDDATADYEFIDDIRGDGAGVIHERAFFDFGVSVVVVIPVRAPTGDGGEAGGALFPVAVAEGEAVFGGGVVVDFDLVEAFGEVADVLELIIIGASADVSVEEGGLGEDVEHGLTEGVEAVGGDDVAGEGELVVGIADDDERAVLVGGLGEVAGAFEGGWHGGLLEALGFADEPLFAGVEEEEFVASFVEEFGDGDGSAEGGGEGVVAVDGFGDSVQIAEEVVRVEHFVAFKPRC